MLANGHSGCDFTTTAETVALLCRVPLPHFLPFCHRARSPRLGSFPGLFFPTA